MKINFKIDSPPTPMICYSYNKSSRSNKYNQPTIVHSVRH